jgi:hypothetical protein
MPSLAFLWFDLQMTQRYLSDITFGSAQSRANSANLNTPIGAGTFRRPSVTQVPLVVSATLRRTVKPGRDKVSARQEFNHE